MSTAELKLNLINKISNISDKVMLNELLELIKFQSDTSIYQTNLSEKKAIASAKNDIISGNIQTNDELQKEIDQWLKK